MSLSNAVVTVSNSNYVHMILMQECGLFQMQRPILNSYSVRLTLNEEESIESFSYLEN